MTSPEFGSLIAEGLKRRKERLANATCAHHEGAGHDCTYVNARNALIPTADRAARQACIDAGLSPDHPHYNRVFFAEMEAAAIDAGLASPPGPWLVEQKRRDEARRVEKRRLHRRVADGVS